MKKTISGILILVMIIIGCTQKISPENIEAIKCEWDKDCIWTGAQVYFPDGSPSDCQCLNRDFLKSANVTGRIFRCGPPKVCKCSFGKCKETNIRLKFNSSQ